MTDRCDDPSGGIEDSVHDTLLPGLPPVSRHAQDFLDSFASGAPFLSDDIETVGTSVSVRTGFRRTIVRLFVQGTSATRGAGLHALIGLFSTLLSAIL
ncbi:hypothetical protein [Mangrovicella endophytica]|uniref:hypothetical protein n=1 Tax=Mangrovicella endophytica TaxID=2066697 RepID=UPI000C9E4F05|nr:hypothetical protein [Mangrovicella endophytica]